MIGARAARSSARCSTRWTSSINSQLPPALVEQEFENLWKTIESEMKNQGKTFADENTTEEKAREDYRKIADRRVRLGLVLAEIGEKNNIKVTDDEVNACVHASTSANIPAASSASDRDITESNPEALANIRAPMFEEKVVDFILALAKVTEKTVSREELYRRTKTRRRPDVAPRLGKSAARFT